MSARTPSEILASLAKRTLPGDRRLTWADLVEQVALEDGVHALLFLGRARSTSIVHARHHFWAALRGAGYSYPEIGAALSVDHSTVIAGVRKHARRAPPQDAGGFAGMGAGAGI